MSLTTEQQDLVAHAKLQPDAFSVGSAWDEAMGALKRDFWGIVLGHLVGYLLIAVGSFLTFGICAPALITGYVRFHQRKLRGEPVEIGELLSGFSDFGQSLGLALVWIVLVSVGYFFCILPGIYLSVAWSFVFFLLADRPSDFWGLMEVSRQVVTGRWFKAFLLLIVIHLIAYAGLLACGIGALVTLPFSMLMFCSAHDRLFRRS